MGSPQDAPPGRVEFSVLGPMRVSAAGRLIQVGPGRRRATLAALLVDVGRVVPLDVLVDRVWDSSPDHPTASVHTYVSRLRAAMRTVQDDGTELAASLLTEPPGYRLDVDPEDVDAVRFERAVTGARTLRRDDPAAARDLLDHALASWRGPAYADTVTAFTAREADRLQQLRLGAQELRVGCELSLGRHEHVLDELIDLVNAEPWRETRHAALLLALYRAGRQAEALRRFERLRTSLAAELGTDPSRELQDLHARILRQDPDLDPPRVEPTPPSSVEGSGVRVGAAAAPVASASIVTAGQLRMVGRDDELRAVAGALESAWSDREQVACAVVGEAGIGKSRLADEAAAEAARGGAVVAWGRCWQHAGATLLWPWQQVVRDLLDAIEPVDPATVATAMSGRGAAVRRLLPERTTSATTRDDPAPTGSLVDTQLQLFDALAAFLGTLAARHRLLLVIEDLHWADPDSCRLAEYLVEHTTHGTPGPAVLLTVRSPHDDPVGPERELMAGLLRTGRTTRVPLRGLSVDDVGRLFTDRTGARLDGPTARALVERTEGNPFFVEEIVRLLVTDPGDDGDGPEVLPTEVPESVREVLLRRLRRMDGAELDVLRAAAVAGRGFDLDLLHAVSGAGPDVVDEAVDHATAVGFLCADPASGPDHHRFTHALAQQTLVEDTGPARRRRLHARIAEVLAGRGAGRPGPETARLVHHLAHAGGSDNLAAAADLGVLVADAATRQRNYREVEATLLHSLDLLSAVDPDDADPRESAVLARLIALYDYFHGPRHPPAEAHRRRALTLARRAGSGRDRLAALSSQAANVLSVADFVSTAAVVEEMLITAEALDEQPLRANGLLVLGMSLMQQGRLTEALVRLDEAEAAIAGLDTASLSDVILTPLETISGWRLLTRALLDAAHAGGSPVGREDPDAVELDRLSDSRVPSIRAYALGQRAIVRAVLDDLDGAHAPAVAAVRVAEDAGLHSVRDYLAPVAAWASPTADRQTLERALAPLEAPESMLMRPFLRTLVADAHLRAGRGADARRWYQRAADEVARTGNDLVAPAAARRLAAL